MKKKKPGRKKNTWKVTTTRTVILGFASVMKQLSCFSRWSENRTRKFFNLSKAARATSNYILIFLRRAHRRIFFSLDYFYFRIKSSIRHISFFPFSLYLNLPNLRFGEFSIKYSSWRKRPRIWLKVRWEESIDRSIGEFILQNQLTTLKPWIGASTVRSISSCNRLFTMRYFKLQSDDHDSRRVKR